MKIWIDTAAEKKLKQFLNTCISTNRTVFVVCDRHTKSACLPFVEALTFTSFADHLVIIQAGEAYKNLENLSLIWKVLLEKEADKRSVLLCLGGGIVCDMGGLAAATFKRGIDHVLIPTSLMAQVDAALGGKTAVNFQEAKNQIGLFAPPLATCVFPQLLKTLPEKEVYAGFAEMLKHALIADSNYWTQLKKVKGKKQMCDTELIKQSIHIKMDICKQDYKEEFQRKKLNFGHTIGHAIEAFCLRNAQQNELSHGHAIAVGMLAASYLSSIKNLLSFGKLQEIKQVIETFYPPIKIDSTHYQELLDLMAFDKKREGENYNFTFLTDIGQSIVNQQATKEEIIKSFDYCLTER